MLRTAFAMLLTCVGLTACNADETVSAYAANLYQLQSIDGAPFAARATLDLSTPGRVTGQAPCNRYFADQSAPYPWFALGPIGATRMACPDLPAETTYLNSLSDMTFAEAQGQILILSNEAGREMVFQALP